MNDTNEIQELIDNYKLDINKKFTIKNQICFIVKNIKESGKDTNSIKYVDISKINYQKLIDNKISNIFRIVNYKDNNKNTTKSVLQKFNLESLEIKKGRTKTSLRFKTLTPFTSTLPLLLTLYTPFYSLYTHSYSTHNPLYSLLLPLHITQ